METIRKYRELYQQALEPEKPVRDMAGRKLLGHAVSMSPVSIEKYEQGITRPSVAAAAMISDVVGKAIHKDPKEILWEICSEYAKKGGWTFAEIEILTSIPTSEKELLNAPAQ